MATKTLAFEIGTEELPAFDLHNATVKLEGLAKVALDGAGIPYHTKFSTPMGRIGGRARANPFQDADSVHDYKIYVRKDDYDRAVQAIQSALREK